MVKSGRIHTPDKFRTAIKITVITLLFSLSPIDIVHADYPIIRALNRNDAVYNQLVQDIGLYYERSAAGDKIPMLQFFRYRTKQEMTLFALASKVNLPYETIATLNGMEHSGTIPPKTTLLLCNLPGLFVPETTTNGLESILHRQKRMQSFLPVSITDEKNVTPVQFRFYPGEHFNSREMSYFLRITFHLPVENGEVSSFFGTRTSPFSGVPLFHSGIDIVARKGTNVTSSKAGYVSELGFDQLFGFYVVIDHGNNYQTFYGHLEKIFVELNQPLNSGMIIGTLGNSGLSTGPHLHFEIRKNGRPVDPVPLLHKEGR